MQNAALKIAESPFPVANRPAHYTLHLFRGPVRPSFPKDDAVSRLLAKEEECCDCATD